MCVCTCHWRIHPRYLHPKKFFICGAFTVFLLFFLQLPLDGTPSPEVRKSVYGSPGPVLVLLDVPRFPRQTQLRYGSCGNPSNPTRERRVKTPMDLDPTWTDVVTSVLDVVSFGSGGGYIWLHKFTHRGSQSVSVFKDDLNQRGNHWVTRNFETLLRKTRDLQEVLSLSTFPKTSTTEPYLLQNLVTRDLDPKSSSWSYTT